MHWMRFLSFVRARGFGNVSRACVKMVFLGTTCECTECIARWGSTWSAELKSGSTHMIGNRLADQRNWIKYGRWASCATRSMSAPAISNTQCNRRRQPGGFARLYEKVFYSASDFWGSASADLAHPRTALLFTSCSGNIPKCTSLLFVRIFMLIQFIMDDGQLWWDFPVAQLQTQQNTALFTHQRLKARRVSTVLCN